MKQSSAVLPPDPQRVSIILQGAKNAAIQDITFRDGSTRAISAHSGNGLTIRNCAFREMGLGAIALVQESNVLIEDCTFEHCDRLAPAGGHGKIIDLYGCRNVVIRNCRFLDQDGGMCVLLWGGTQDVTITGCTFANIMRKERDRDGNGPYGADDGAVYLNQGFNGEPITQRIEVSGNTFTNCKGMGVYMDGPNASSPAGATFCREVLIKENSFVDTRVGVLLWGEKCVVFDNRFVRVGMPYGTIRPGAGNVVDGTAR